MKKDNLYGSFLYGEYLYSGDKAEDEQIILRPCEEIDLMKYFPDVFRVDTPNWEKVTSIIEIYLCEKHRLAKDLEKQGAVDTATWGLVLWEDLLDLHGEDADLDSRREIIKARLRGRGKTTKQVIINVAEAFSGGEVEVEEHPGEFYFVVKFVGKKGIPKNLNAFRKQLDIIKPSHLDYMFEFIFLTWGMFDYLGITWGELEENQVTWGDLREYRVNEIDDDFEGGI